ncbi:hypothetical protein HDU99_009927, partial [Rhizoclosmatium hyalinum]
RPRSESRLLVAESSASSSDRDQDRDRDRNKDRAPSRRVAVLRRQSLSNALTAFPITPPSDFKDPELLALSDFRPTVLSESGTHLISESSELIAASQPVPLDENTKSDSWINEFQELRSTASVEEAVAVANEAWKRRHPEISEMQ